MIVYKREHASFGLASKSARLEQSISSLVCRTPEVPLIYWVSDTLSQGYTNLQSLVNRLDYKDFASDAVCSKARSC